MMEQPMVLIVDDDDLQLLLMKDIFDAAGIRATYASNGRDALAQLAANRYRYLITDLHMPLMNGLELAEKAKELAPQMVVALCTGEDVSSMKGTAVEKGIDTIFNKPVDYARLMNVVRAGLRHQVPGGNPLSPHQSAAVE